MYVFLYVYAVCVNMCEYVRICAWVNMEMVEYVHVVCGRHAICMCGICAAIRAAEYASWLCLGVSVCVSICACCLFV